MFDHKEYWKERAGKRKEMQVSAPISNLSVFARSSLPPEGKVNHSSSREQKRQHKARMITRNNP